MRRSASSWMSCPANKTKEVKSSSRRETLDLNDKSITSEQLKSIEHMNVEDAQAKTISLRKTVADKPKKDDTSDGRFEKSRIIMTSNTQQQGFDNGSYDVSRTIADKRRKDARSVKSVSGLFSTKKVCESISNQALLADSSGIISKNHTNKTDELFAKTSEPVEAAVSLDKFPLHNPKNKSIGKAKAQENSTNKRQNPDFSTREKRAGRKKRCKSVLEGNPVLPPKIRKSLENSNQCASPMIVQNTRTDDTANSNLMQINKIILSLPENSSFLLRLLGQGNSMLKCPKCSKVFKQLKLGSMHYSKCKNFKLTKTKEVSISPSLLVLICNLCYFTFDNLTKLCEHQKVCQLRKSPDMSFESATYRDKYKCKKCCYECFSSIKFKEHSCNKNIEQMQSCSIKIPSIDIMQSRKSILQYFECTMCYRLFLNKNSFKDHMKIAHNLKVPATESLKKLTVHNPFCSPTSQIKIKNFPMNKENSTEKEKSKQRKDTTCGNNNKKAEQGRDKEHTRNKMSSGQTNSSKVQTFGSLRRSNNKTDFNTIQSVGSVEISRSKIFPDSIRASSSIKMSKSKSTSGNIQETRSLKKSGNQTNFSNIQESGSEKISNCPFNGEGLFTVPTTGCSEDVQWPFLRETICKCRGYLEPEKDIKPCVECLNKSVVRSEDEDIKPRIDSLDDCREEECDMATESIETNSKNFRAFGSVTMSNGQTVSSETQASKLEEIAQAYRRMASKTRNLKPTECSEDFEGPYSKRNTCRCQGRSEEDIKPCEECLNRSILRSVEQTMNRKFNPLKDSEEEECEEDSLDIDMVSERTVDSDPVSLQPLYVRDDLSIPIYESPGRRFSSKEEECGEDNLYIDVVSQNTDSGSVCSKPQSVRDDLSIPIYESPRNRFNSTEEDCEEDNLEIDVVSPKISNSGLACSQSRSVGDKPFVPFDESPGDRFNIREEEGQESSLDINMVSRKTNSVPVCSQSRSSGRDALLISLNAGSSPRDAKLGDNLDFVLPKTLNSGLPHSSQSVRDNILIPGAVSSCNPRNSGEEECVEDNLDLVPQDTQDSVQPIPCQGSIKEITAHPQNDVNCAAMTSGGEDCTAALLKNVANNTDLSPGSGCNVRLSNLVDSSKKASTGFDEAEPTSVVSNGTESLRGIDDEDGPVFESILDLSKLLTCDRKYESDEDYYDCVSKRLQYVTRKLVVQREEEDEPSGECLRIDSSKRWIAEELENNILDVGQIAVKHCRISWGPFDADAHSVIRSHNGENVLSYICDHCFMEFNLDSLKAHLCSLFGRPINNEIKVAYARDNLL